MASRRFEQMLARYIQRQKKCRYTTALSFIRRNYDRFHELANGDCTQFYDLADQIWDSEGPVYSEEKQ